MKNAVVLLGVCVIFVLFLIVQQAFPQSPAGVTPSGTFSYSRETMLKDGERGNLFTSSYLNEKVEENQPSFDGTLLGKAGDGATNLATFWADVPWEIGNVASRENLLAGLTVGFAQGVVSGLKRGTAGTVDIVTSEIPPHKSLMKPEFKVEDPDDASKVRIKLLSW